MVRRGRCEGRDARREAVLVCGMAGRRAVTPLLGRGIRPRILGMMDGVARAAPHPRRVHELPPQRTELGHVAHRLVGDRHGDYLHGLRVDHHVQFHKTAFYPPLFAHPLAPVVLLEPGRVGRQYPGVCRVRHGYHPALVRAHVKPPHPLAELLKEGVLDSPIIFPIAPPDACTGLPSRP